MRTRIVRIGNSRGIRIPRAVLRQCKLEDAVELEAGKRGLLVRPVGRPRAGWDEAFSRMAAAGDDQLLDRAGADWDRKDWEW